MNTQNDWRKELIKFMEEGIWHKGENGKQYKWFYLIDFISSTIQSEVDKERERIINSIITSDKNFGIVDKNDKGGAILIEDIINLISSLNEVK